MIPRLIFAHLVRLCTKGTANSQCGATNVIVDAHPYACATQSLSLPGRQNQTNRAGHARKTSTSLLSTQRGVTTPTRRVPRSLFARAVCAPTNISFPRLGRNSGRKLARAGVENGSSSSHKQEVAAAAAAPAYFLPDPPEQSVWFLSLGACVVAGSLSIIFFIPSVCFPIVSCWAPPVVVAVQSEARYCCCRHRRWPMNAKPRGKEKTGRAMFRVSQNR